MPRFMTRPLMMWKRGERQLPATTVSALMTDTPFNVMVLAYEPPMRPRIGPSNVIG